MLSALPLASAGSRRARRRQRALRRSARHHARVRLHADRRRAGLSDSSAEPSPARIARRLEVARELWPTLATGVASTCIAYLTFLFSGVVGLQQLACFTVAGLAVAGLTTRFAVARAHGRERRDQAESQLSAIRSGAHSNARSATSMWIAAALLRALPALRSRSTGTAAVGERSEQTHAGAGDLLLQDQELRSQLGTPDVRYLLVIDAPDRASRRSRASSRSMRRSRN